MTPRPRLPIYAHWDGQEFRVDRPASRAEPEIGEIVRLEIEEGCTTQRRPFRVVDKRDRLGESLLAPTGDGSQRVAVDLDVEPLGLPS